MKSSIQLCLTSGAFLYSLLALTPSQAQVIPDNTLPNNSNVTNENNISIITGGTQAGSNLFHSFENFSVSTGGTAYFNNLPKIQNIFSRITGNSVSNIDGLIRANGTTNLFLINPNGIIFGSNARLNIGGSFLASTASSLKFADGKEFSATKLQATPLLTVSVPVGLQFGKNQGSILVQGNGHDVIALNYQPLNRGNTSNTALKVKPGKTLALVGGDVKLEGGILNTEGGRVEIGSVEQGLVSLNLNIPNWFLGYEEATAFKDITLSQRSLIDVSGVESGSIQIQGKSLQLSGASLILSQNQGFLPSGDIKINASESIKIEGFEPYSFDSKRGLVSGIWSETLGRGKGGEISLFTSNLTLQSSGQIFSATDGAAKAGNINLSVSQSLQLIGSLTTGEGGVSVNSLSLGSGRAGDITIASANLNVVDGGYILTSNIAPSIPGIISEGAGNININATDFINLSGTALDLSIPSAISAATFSNGNAGNVTINTSKLRLSNGGRIDSSTGASGSAGSITINAYDLVEVSGTVPGYRNPSLIISSANIVDESLQTLLKLSPKPSGGSGDITINTRQLNVIDRGQITVRNDGSGDAGKLQVQADSANLSNGSGITATTASGEGGNIFVRSQNLQLRTGSKITTDATGGSGNGGNIAINAGILFALEKSTITADAFQGQGGNIKINTQGLFQSPDSKITASSDYGIDGTVQINTLTSNPNNGLVELPSVPVDISGLVAQGCKDGSGAKGASFVVAGRGGLPPQPGEPLRVNAVRVTGTTEADTENHLVAINSQTTLPVSSAQLVEANGWLVNSKGDVVLLAQPSQPSITKSSDSALTCYAP